MTGSWSLALRLARRELRGGIKGFGIFLACLSLGVAAISAVGMVRAAIERGITDQGAVILGGDAQIEFTYRFADDEERAFMAEIAETVSEIVDFRSLAVTDDAQVLVAVKAVDGAWPLYGQVQIEGDLPLEQALAGSDGLPGGLMETVLAQQMGLEPGDTFALGAQSFRLTGILLREPDSALGGFSFAPRVIVRLDALATSGLLVPGTLFDSAYRLKLDPAADLEALETAAEAGFRDKGLRWQDRRRAAPGVERFVERLGSFLVLVGLAGMAVGGVGIASAVRAWLDGRIATLATLKTIGAEQSLVFRIYLLQVAALTGLGILLGLVLGVALPALAGPWIEAQLPFPAEITITARPVVEAAFYGATTALLFALWPLSRAAGIKTAALYRDGLSGGVSQGRPKGAALWAMAALALALIGGAVAFSGLWEVTLSVAGGVMVALLALMLAARGLERLARRLSRLRSLGGGVALRLALSSVGARAGGTVQVVLALGLGLSVLATLGQVDANMRRAIAAELPARAPSFFFVDIQPDQIDTFRAMMAGNPAVTRLETAPMLRGLVTRINGKDAREASGNHWVVESDRGLTYADALPDSAKLTGGTFWDKGHAGDPQISFAAEEAIEMGLKLGDEITVSVLGREITAELTSFREVDFRNAGMGFVMMMNEASLKGAPHSHIATVYAETDAEAAILREVSKAYPNVTAIGMKAAIGRVTETLTAIGQAVTIAALVTLATGFVVLVGAAAAGERARRHEAAVLKVLGAARARILWSFALRAMLTGAAAGLVAILTGALAGWAIMVLVMESSYTFELSSALAIVLGGIVATLLAGLVFMLRPLAARPAGVLRAVE